MRKCYLLGIAALLLAFAAIAQASPTGLNNIPTAEVVSKDVLVLQSWGSFDGDDSWFAGFKYGPAQNWEIGLDDDVAGVGSSAGITLQVKYRIPFEKAGGVALGLANVSADTDVNGERFPYVVVTVPLTADAKANGTAGYQFQSGNHGFFVGASYCCAPQFNLRADWTQINDGDASVSSLGFITQLDGRWLAEAWASFPTGAGAETSYTVKVDYVVARR